MRPDPPLFKPLEPNSDRISVPDRTSLHRERSSNDENDQKRRVVHLCASLNLAPRPAAVESGPGLETTRVWYLGDIQGSASSPPGTQFQNPVALACLARGIERADLQNKSSKGPTSRDLAQRRLPIRSER